MIVSRHSRPSVPYPTSPLRHFPPSPLSSNSFPLTLLADPHPLNPVVSIFYKNIGGRGYVPCFQPPKAPFASRMNLRDLPTCKRVLIYPLFFHNLAHSFALFCIHQNLNSFVFKRFRTLRQKTPGVGEGGRRSQSWNLRSRAKWRKFPAQAAQHGSPATKHVVCPLSHYAQLSVGDPGSAATAAGQRPHTGYERWRSSGAAAMPIRRSSSR